MKILLAALCISLIGLLAGVIFLSIRTRQVQGSPNQKLFLKGKVPKNPQGFYKGSTVPKIETSWLGKRFDSKKSWGINRFKSGSKHDERYPFKTYTGKGIQDRELSVLKIDYSDNKDPWWLRFILDEVVEVAPGKFLGKVHIVAIPGLPFSVGYFRLEK